MRNKRKITSHAVQHPDTCLIPTAGKAEMFHKPALIQRSGLDGEKGNAIASPARNLQEQLNDMVALQAMDYPYSEAKYPFVWTLIGLTAVCGVFWVGLIHLLA